LCWIKSKTAQAFENGIQFHPLPRGEGRGEGEEDVTNPIPYKFADHFLSGVISKIILIV
jgi:hypothetical protein